MLFFEERKICVICNLLTNTEVAFRNIINADLMYDLSVCSFMSCHTNSNNIGFTLLSVLSNFENFPMVIKISDPRILGKPMDKYCFLLVERVSSQPRFPSALRWDKGQRSVRKKDIP